MCSTACELQGASGWSLFFCADVFSLSSSCFFSSSLGGLHVIYS